ncbi:MAG TPA: D-Ala-D-Ala carboxypeptidase family metallohydrolase [Sphingomicrobium sp.]|nr:D-Ala-D-Ala carboxypeptidase family metallohydrolase [Sphingomicrobium sp.]
MSLLIALSIAASAQPVAAPPPPLGWQPAAAYVTAGQDEPGYRAWYMASPRHGYAVKSFNHYLVTYGVGGIVPTWQLLRTASSWQRCGAQPFEVPPTSEWPNVVQTLRYVRDFVIPAVGPVEPVSAYRNPVLNVCAGGAPESAHKHYSAIDLVPLRPTNREELMRTLCAVHPRRGPDYGVGLGFYAFLRFHVDTTKYRRWGADPGSTECPPIIRPSDVASVYQPPQAPQPPVVAPAPALADPLAPVPSSALPPAETVPAASEPALPPQR